MLYIANLKCYLTVAEELDFVKKEMIPILKKKEALQDGDEIVICPQFLTLREIASVTRRSSESIKIGAQSCSPVEHGATTGAIPVDNLVEINCDYCIVAHSETKQYEIYEPDLISKKIAILLLESVNPIICFSEQSDEELLNIITNALNKLFVMHRRGKEPKRRRKKKIVFAYEPEYAIGKTEAAPAQEIEKRIKSLKNKITEEIISDFEYKFVYGGSVNSTNCEKLKKIKGLDGFLIGRASIKTEEFEKIINLK